MFTDSGVRYASAEHFMMAEKARLFLDDASLAKSLASKPHLGDWYGRFERGRTYPARWRVRKVLGFALMEARVRFSAHQSGAGARA